MIYTLLDITLADLRCNILKLIKPEQFLEPQSFRGGNVIGSVAEWISVELRVRWGRETSKEELVQTDEKLRTVLLRMKNRGWTGLLLVICNMSRYVEGIALEEGKARRGKQSNKNTSDHTHNQILS
jgi:hypothetical protein